MRDGRNVIRRRRAILAALVVTSVLLLTAYFGEGSEGGVLHSISGGVQTALGPIEEGVSTVFKPVRDFTSWVGDTITATGQNDELRAEVASLRERLAGSEVAARDADQLREIAKLDRESEYPVDSDPVVARVILQPPDRLVFDRPDRQGRERRDRSRSAGRHRGGARRQGHRYDQLDRHRHADHRRQQRGLGPDHAQGAARDRQAAGR